jgi:hypothetical protein
MSAIPFMQAVLSNSLASVLLLLAAVGSCWRCAHDCPRCDRAELAACSSSCCEHCAHAGQKPQAPCPCQVVCQRVGVYLPSQRTHVDAPSQWLPFGDVPAAATFASSPLATSPSLDGLFDALAGKPALPLHLLHQQLLI